MRGATCRGSGHRWSPWRVNATQNLDGFQVDVVSYCLRCGVSQGRQVDDDLISCGERCGQVSAEIGLHLVTACGVYGIARIEDWPEPGQHRVVRLLPGELEQ